MKSSFRTALIALAPSIFIISGCEKNSDYFFPGKYGEAGKYQIKMVTINPPYADFTDTIRFTYNKYDNPVKGIRSEVRTGSPNYIFKYDKFQRMIALIASYGTTETEGIETWTKYTYDAKGRIAKDSVWIFPEVVNGQPIKATHSAMTISLYEYDTKDRIKKVTWLREKVEPYITEYSYDNSGNRVGANYDNKVNYHLTNKLWMFLARDYSLNNPLVGSYAYNGVGLPLTINCGEVYSDFLDMPFVPIYYTNLAITYNK